MQFSSMTKSVYFLSSDIESCSISWVLDLQNVIGWVDLMLILNVHVYSGSLVIRVMVLGGLRREEVRLTDGNVKGFVVL